MPSPIITIFMDNNAQGTRARKTFLLYLFDIFYSLTPVNDQGTRLSSSRCKFNWQIQTSQGQTHLSYREFAESTVWSFCLTRTIFFGPILIPQKGWIWKKWRDQERLCQHVAPFRGHTLVTQRRYFFADKHKQNIGEASLKTILWVLKIVSCCDGKERTK